MLTATIEVKFNRLPPMPADLRKRVDEIIEGAAFAVEAQAKAVVPVDTGALKNSIQAAPEDDAGGRSGTWIVSTGETTYAAEVEFGSNGRAARPYFTPAVELVRPRFLGQMQSVVEEIAN